MLSWLQIKNFAIAEHIELEPGTGLNVITGETGAGKSIIIRALSLVLGQRAETGMIKHGQSRSEIQAVFDISSNKAAKILLRELELDDEDECQLRRVIKAESGSKAYINGRMVTAGILRQVGELLLDIHGQNEHQSLLRTETQRELLDSYAGISDQVSSLQDCYQTLRQGFESLQQLRAEAAAAHERLDFLKYQVEELDRFAPEAGEWMTLHTQHQRIHHQAELVAALNVAEQALFGDSDQSSSADAQLSAALTVLEKAREFDPRLDELSRLISEAQTLVEEVETGLRQAAEGAAFDEQELASIEQRYTAFVDYARKHRVEPGQLYNLHQDLSQQLENSKNPQQSEQLLQDEIRTGLEVYRKLAVQLSQQRSDYAQRLSLAVTRSMQSLAMEGGEFKVVLSPVTPGLDMPDDVNLLDGIGRETGLEKISYEVSTNTGMPSLPLGRIASGGELSRISLAMQLNLADPTTANALVFDEVDVGVGGKTAAVIGKMLAQLASDRQILCITHLPQVASYGTRHFRVNKQQNDQVLLDIIALDEAGRVNEIARMVGGENTSDESLAHARSLIEDSRK